jgi:hypothetical protein
MSNSFARVEQVGRITYRYPAALPLQITALSLVGVAVVILATSRRATGSVAAELAIVLVGVWAVSYTFRRLRNPIRFEIEAGIVRAKYFRGRVKSWELTSLRVRPASLATWWEGATVIMTTHDQVAFRIFRDLIGYREFAAAVVSQSHSV